MAQFCADAFFWIESETEDFDAYSSIELFQDTKDIDQELHTGLLCALLFRSVSTQSGSIPRATQDNPVHLHFGRYVETVSH